MEVKIKGQDKLIDATIEMVDGVIVVSPIEKYVPKDGDVVVNGRFIFIYNDWMTAEAYYYCGINLITSKTLFPDGGHFEYVNQLRPATEEEKKLLFDKIAEEGYEFDFEKKELIKLNWKPMAGQGYYIPAICNAQFKAAKEDWSDDAMDVLYFNKGWVFRTKEECQEFCDKLNQAINQVK